MARATAQLARANLLLASLPSDELERVIGLTTVRDLAQNDLLVAPGEPAEEAIFPIGAILSVISDTADGNAVEVGTTGREGMGGLPAFLGARSSPLRVICQVDGRALVGRTVDLVGEDPVSPLRVAALRYAHHMMIQASITAACNRLHPLEQRAARWLLTIADRKAARTFRLTHEFFAIMLGAQRPSVTLAAQMLQRGGLISYTRGKLEILDYDGLVGAACECYATVTEDYERSMGFPMR